MSEVNLDPGYDDDEGTSLDMLHEEEEEDEEGEKGEHEEEIGENPQKSSRDECMDRLKSGRREVKV